MSCRRRTVAGTIIATALVALAGPAAAQSVPGSGGDDDAARRALVEQAQRACDAGEHGAALALATIAGQMRMTPSLRLFLAEEERALGHAREALAHAEACRDDARRAPELRNRARILAACTALAAELRPHVAAPSPALASYAAAPRVPASRTPRAFATVRGGGPVYAPLPTPRDVLGPADRSAGNRVGPFVLMGAGAASVAASLAFLALRDGAAAGCTAEGAALVCDTRESARRAEAAPAYNALFGATLGLGLATAAGGLIWFGVTRARASSPPRASIAVVPTPGGTHATFRVSM